VWKEIDRVIGMGKFNILNFALESFSVCKIMSFMSSPGSIGNRASLKKIFRPFYMPVSPARTVTSILAI
jgi:hypothetical protein